MPQLSPDHDRPGTGNAARPRTGNGARPRTGNGARPGTDDGAGPSARVSILDLDRGLAAALGAEDRHAARRYAVADVLEIPKGIYDPQTLVEPDGLLGLLVISGLMIRRVAIADRHCGELVGAGGVLRPWDDFGTVSPLPFEVRWRVTEPLRLARLDRRFLATIVRWPALVETFTSRIVERTHALAFIVAVHCLRHVDLRLLAFLWHLADRYGRVIPDGVRIPLRLSHSDLAELIGAARPSVSLAVSRLSQRGLAWRCSDATWMLTADPPDTIRDLRRRAHVV